MLVSWVVVVLLVCSGGSSSLPIPREREHHHHRGWSHELSLPSQKERPGRWHLQSHHKDLLQPTEHAFHNSAGATSAFLNPRRCGVPDLPSGKNIQHGSSKRKRRFVLAGGRWNKTDLTYKIVRFPWQLNQVKVRQAIAEAVRVWSDVTPLTFTEVQDTSADIIIEFTRYWHGDNLPFDGPGGVLAHAFYPQTPRAGNIHFDYDELWTTDSNKGTDLLQVAAHEFGHALGLQHSKVPKSLMSPYYTFRYPLSLAEDDRQGIQYLYGSSHGYGVEHPDRNTETNELPRVDYHGKEPDACETDFDAVSMIRGELFFFKSEYVWRLRDGHLQPGYPALASRHWRAIHDHIDAGFEDSSGNFWFFQGSNYWIYDGENQVLGPRLISELGLSAVDIQAALMWGLEEKRKIYFFKGNNYWRFNMNQNALDSFYPRNTNDWRGIPANINGAFQDEHGYAYFLRGRYYWKFDPVQMKVQEGYPRLIGHDFFGCASSRQLYT
ncbi:stromelysin-3-like isoform X1 [Chiloscyllium plagiosum]|uniref:stromelysin-3-like isoform X1 n=1 Tax=Chiloscyllium plagiosum TaxID=36176 RepID=UPI001CB80AD6|nr:stromelysin-3-like isoform X1 [Chiloscyllium plagiosum]